MKVCFKCKGEPMPISNFYENHRLKGGYSNKCKDCTKLESRLRNERIYSSPEGLISERKRNREKYKRLNYHSKQKQWDANKPWKSKYDYKNLHRNLNIQKGFHAHHWSYEDENLKSVFILTSIQHKKAHSLLTFMKEKKCFHDDSGNVLDTKEKHLQFLLAKKII